MRIKRAIATIVLAIALVGLAQAATVSAVGGGVTINVPNVGCLIGDESQCPTTVEGGNIGQSIVRIYQFAVGIAGILAVGMIVAGSLYVSASAGRPDKQNEGKDMITSAIWGLILLFGSYVILNTVNPRLVALEEPNVAELQPCEYDENGEVVNTEPCVPAPYRYEPIPGEEPTTRLTDEAYQQARAAWPERVTYCETLRGISEDRLRDCVINGGNCNGCENLDPRLQSYMKPDRCRWDSEPVTVATNCLVRPRTNSALLSLSPKLSEAGIHYSITEVYPPTAEHISQTHYNGCSVDITVSGSGSLTQCDAVAQTIRKAQESGFSVFNEYRNCGGVDAKTTTGSHLHLTTQNCP